MPTRESDIVCFSHLRWDFVYQRPQHLMSRFAARHRVFFIEEPIPGDDVLGVTSRPCGAQVLVPQLRPTCTQRGADTAQRELLERHFAARGLTNPILWYYTPMALPVAASLDASLVVYDCMDELSAFHGAPPHLAALELDLFKCADLVFTGGRSLHAVKSRHHPRVYAFPSSVDLEHFKRARSGSDRRDRAGSLHIGYMGVVDERFDVRLIASVAKSRPEWRIEVLGPVVKIDASTLPQLPNITYTGLRSYDHLPSHLARWDVALIPFVRDAVTRFVSPTKLLEYFAAGVPVVSTSIPDVVDPYGAAAHVAIADDPDAFVEAVERAAAHDRAELLCTFDRVLAETSWDRTWRSMAALMDLMQQSPDRLPSTRTACERTTI